MWRRCAGWERCVKRCRRDEREYKVCRYCEVNRYQCLEGVKKKNGMLTREICWTALDDEKPQESIINDDLQQVKNKFGRTSVRAAIKVSSISFAALSSSVKCVVLQLT